MKVNMISIDAPLYQWDTGREVSITPIVGMTVHEVHFARLNDETALVVSPKTEGGNITASIPNILLQTDQTISVYVVLMVGDGERTFCKKNLLVNKRTRPSDYAYTETEVQTWNTLDERLKKVEENASALMIVEVDGTKASYTAEEIYNHVQNGGSVIAKSSLYIFTLDRLNDYYANFVNVSGTRIASLSVDVYGAVTVTNKMFSPDDAEQIAMLAEADMLPAVHDTSGAMLTDENGNAILRY